MPLKINMSLSKIHFSFKQLLSNKEYQQFLNKYTPKRRGGKIEFLTFAGRMGLIACKYSAYNVYNHKYIIQNRIFLAL
ncbi:hypothetical protein MNBD_BACTEROID01-217 [hydrothermal vent metagenome]|uniref:Uncharacterized protein n=1 Tax=hydrothermal vent metagenome TaxID=652676 RepID=A0A3B0UP93_9ZZZZ